MEWLAEFGGAGNLSAIGVVVVVVLAIITGKLIPEKMHQRIVDAGERENATLKTITGRQAGQVDKLVEQGESTLKLLQALSTPPTKDTR